MSSLPAYAVTIRPPRVGAGTPVVPPRKLTLAVAPKNAAGPFQDAETRSLWDVAGRCVEGELKGYTLEWVDSVQVKWFAWVAEHPESFLGAFPLFDVGVCSIPFDNLPGFIAQRAGSEQEPPIHSIEPAETRFELSRPA